MTVRNKAAVALSDLIDGKYTAIQIEDMLCSWICYYQFYQDKKNGKKRLITAPDSSLKKMQKLVLNNVLYRFPVHKNMFGFVPDVSMREGACVHFMPFLDQQVVSRWMLNIDLENCFPSVRANILQNMFEDIFAELLWDYGVRDEDVFFEFCKIMVDLTTHNGRLTQGAPTSPYLTNLVISWSGIADDLQEYCDKQNLFFSIYADDIAISSVDNNQIFIEEVIKCIESHGIFTVNPEKIHLNHIPRGSHRITGMSFHVPKFWSDGDQTRLTLPKKRQGYYRGRIWHLVRLLREGCVPNKKEHGISIEQIEGYITWIRHVCGENIPSSLRKPIAIFEEMISDHQKSNQD